MHRNELCKLLNNLNLTEYGVELGVSAGAFSKEILKSSKLKVLFSIDRWSDHHDYAQYKSAVKRLSEYNERSVVLRLPFEKAVYLFKDAIFDFIYIDGYAHTGQDDGRTIKEWWPKLKAGGVFAGHDYCKTKWPKTFNQVNKFVARHNLKLQVTQEKKWPSWYCIK